MIGKTGTTRSLSLISLALLGALVAPACGEADSDDDGVGGSAGGGGKATSGGSKATTGGATAKGGATSTGGISSASGGAATASGGKATAGTPGTGDDGGEPGFPGFPGGGQTGEGGASGGAEDCDGVAAGEACDGFGAVCEVGGETCACLPTGQGSSEWSCTGTGLPGSGGSGGAGSAFDCDGAVPVDGEACDGTGTLCETDDGGVCACFGESWSCFGGEDLPGAGGAGTGFGGRQGAGGRNQGGRTGFGGRESFGQGGA